MRLVGASTLYIALPFLLEALVTALLGVALAGGAPWWRSCSSASTSGSQDRAQLHPVDRLARGPCTPSVVIAILGPMLTLIPTLVLTRKYLKV